MRQTGRLESGDPLSKDGALRIPFVIARSNKKTREWFRGTMLHVRRNPSWYLRIFEIDGRASKGVRVLDFGGMRPDGVVCCGVPFRFVRRALKEQGFDHVPVVCFPQGPVDDRTVGTVALDVATIARTACGLFKKRGCRHAAYVGAHAPGDVRMSRALRRAFSAEAAAHGLSFSSVRRKVSQSYGMQITDAPDLMAWLESLPKPCGILTWNDLIGRDVLDLCRLGDIAVPGSAYVLAIDDNDLVCDNSFPTLSSVLVDYERTASCAAQLLDDLMQGRTPSVRHLTCSVRGVTERASTQDAKGAARIVSLAREFIADSACTNSSLDQRQVAAHVGVSVRTLQQRFKESAFGRTILQEIQYVRLTRVCWLLVHTSQSISDITYAAGFRSQSRLKALFQAKFQMSMRDYRKVAKIPPPPR